MKSGPFRLLVLFAAITSGLGFAQTQPAPLATQRIEDRVRVTLRGNVHPLAQSRYDRGAVSDSFPAERMFLLLQRSPEQESALREFILNAHSTGNPAYHKWLRPEQFAAYGPADSDIAATTAWLQSHGFAVARITRGKTAIEFSGNAGQIRAAFNTEIHTYLVNGEEHHANNRDPQIPTALAPVVAGITPLNDFRPKSYMRVLGQALYDPKTHILKPEWTLSGNPPVLALAPGDFAVQYDLNPLYNAGINGSGVTIGIIGAADVDPTTIANYRTLFGLPPVNLSVIIDSSDPTPGEGNWATGESYLDVEEAGAVAPGASINLYTAADTSVQSGLLLAAQRAVDDDQAPVLSTSYGTCEQDLGSAGNQFWATLWEQAAAQGQTSFVSAGDGGSAGCDDFGEAQPAQYGLAVSGFSSTPWNISVGGTDFYYSTYSGSSSAQLAQIGTYWDLNSTNAPAVSLLQPVPEQPWNQAFGLNLYDGGVYDPTTNGPTIVAGGGGASTLYTKPAWQSGKGVTADGQRDLPDVSLFASAGGNDSFYLVCGGTDACFQDGLGYYGLDAVGGTSASSPAMAGIMALINQKYGPQGQANFILYLLAVQHPSVFHDIAISSNNVPCGEGTPDCTLSTLTDNTNGFDTLGKYYAIPGYDRASGLGSVDANLLVQYWNSLRFTSTTTALTLSQTTFTHGTPVKLNVAVGGAGGTPSGDAGLVTTATPASNTSMGELTLKSGAASETIDNLPGGTYQIVAKYTGDTTFAPSNSNPVTLDVAPEAGTITLSGVSWSNASNAFVPIANGHKYPYGTYFAIDAQPRGVNAPQGSLDGLATGTVTFTDSAGGTTVNSGAINITREGIAEWVPLLTLPVGANSISASYPGDPSFNASSSTTPVTFTITKATPYTFLDAYPSTVALGSSTSLIFQVGAGYDSPEPAPPYSTFNSSSPISPTGTVTYSFGTTVLGTVPIAAGYGGLYGSQATLNVNTLPLGTDTVTAKYSGDGNYNPASASFKVAVEQAPGLSGIANPGSINQAEYTAITATVTGLSGMPVPTGTVSFAAPAGSVNYWNDTETLNNGSATSRPLPGEDFLGNVMASVSYSGDSTYGPANIDVSFTVTEGTVSPFTLSGTPVTIATAGATANNTSTVTTTPAGGFTGTLYLSCTLISSPSGAERPPTCSIPASVNVTGTSAVMATMTVNSTAPSTIAALIAPFPRGMRWFLASTGSFAGAILLIGIPRRRCLRRAAASLTILITLGILLACGGSPANSGGGGTTTIPGTTAGAYTFTVNGALTANGVSQVQTMVSVTIQ
ncbi:MAG: Ig-like domain repeat protein [Candidatus Sulfotelmatobacter sp.]